MSTCQEWDESLTLLAASALEPAEQTQVRAHVDACAACRGELAALQDVLGLAALPSPTPRELALQEALPRTTESRWRRAQVQRAAHLRTTGSLLVAAAVLLFVLGPVMPRPGSAPLPPSALAPVTSEATLPAQEDVVALEQWAQADPLSDALDGADSETSDTREAAGPADAPDAESDELLSSPSLGDAL